MTRLAAAIRAASANGAPWFDGFDWRAMDGGSHGAKILAAIHAAGGTGWFAYWQDIDAARMAQARALGLSVSAWTVNGADTMQRPLRWASSVDYRQAGYFENALAPD